MVIQRAVDWADDRITERPGTVVLVFLVATAVFATGLTAVETETGQQQFIEDLPSFEAFQDIQREFGASFGTTTTSTTLIQDGQNVLSKPGLLRMLHTQERIASQDALRVTGTSSPAQVVARTLDPGATTLEAQITAVERATPGEIDAAVRTAAERNAFGTQVSSDFNARAASASAAEATVTHGAAEIPGRVERVERVASSVGTDIVVLGDQPDTITDSLVLVMPAALVFIVLFLIVAYRDAVDLLLGLVAIFMTLIWTFGFLGLAGIPFNVILVSVPPLLIAVGIDFGIHAVNRYREERARGHGIERSMRLTTDQLLVAFFIVTGTTVIGFLSNLVSAFPPIRDFGLTAAIGIVFTFLIFGVFLPAEKVFVDRLRERYPIPTVSQTPLGSEGSALGRVLAVGVAISERAPLLFVLAIVVSTAGAGVYATGVGTGFEPDDFLPPEETPGYLQTLPEPFRPPAEYEFVKRSNFQDENFDQQGQVLVFVQGPMERDSALETIHRAGTDPPPTFRRDDRQAQSRSVVTLIRARARADPEFRRLVERNDRNDNGIPDQNLEAVYDALEADVPGQLGSLLGEDRRSAQVIYTVDGDADDSAVTADAREVADRYRFAAAPTGFAIVFQEASTLIFETVVQSLALTLVGASVFLVFIYWLLEGTPSLGVANVVPIMITVAFVVASMRLFGVKFNAINGSILAITIGLGIDYSVHFVHRFADEFDERALQPALRRTVVGTGGALTGSMLTTVFGVGVLVLALNPAIGVFGLLTALSVIYAYVASLLVMPSVLVLWARVTGAGEGTRAGEGTGEPVSP